MLRAVFVLDLKKDAEKIFAIVGMCGSGKSTASDMLIELNWEYIRFGQATIDKLQAEGKAITPENEKSAREALREQYGMGAFATLALYCLASPA